MDQPAIDVSVPVEHVPVTDNSPISALDAANALVDYRNKRDAKERNESPSAINDAARKAMAGEEPQPDNSAEKPIDAAPETDPGDKTETTDPVVEELPPIEPPRSWTKEEKEEFKSYPREAQEKIARREQDRESTLRRGQNELAEQRKAVEAERLRIDQARQQYDQTLPQLLQAIRDAQSGEFADIKSQADIDKLASEDWPRFAKYQAHLMKVANLEHEVKQAQERQTNEFRNKWSEFASKEDALFIEKAPEMADKEKATKVADASVALLKDIGFSETDLAKLWNGEASLSLRDHRAQLLIRDAARYRAAQVEAPKKIAVKPVPPVQKPGTAPARGQEQEDRIRNLEKQLERSGSQKDATALLLARRARQ